MNKHDQKHLTRGWHFVWPLLLVLAGLSSLVTFAPAQENVEPTPHNLLPTGPRPLPEGTRLRLCVYCHPLQSPPGAAPLWDPTHPATTFQAYDSPALKARPGQPTGSARLCRSCHDGVLASGDLSGWDLDHVTTTTVLPPGHAPLATTAGGQHPMSFNYGAALRSGAHLRPSNLWDPRVQLDNTSQVQCMTCHDPHDNRTGNFLTMDNQGAALCRVCHEQPFFSLTGHAISTQKWNGKGPNPWLHTEFDDVRGNACLNCHAVHHAAEARNLPVRAPQDELCFACHNGNVAPSNMESIFLKPYHHPVEWPQADPKTKVGPDTRADHVQCTDCHNPHRVQRTPATPPNVKGVLAGVRGVDAHGQPVAEARYEYEICFKCHGYTTRPPLDSIARRVPTYNLLRVFDPSSPSFHPVETPGRNFNVPSLILPLTPASMIYCTDCHSNNQPQPYIPGTAGPHGSSYQFLLAAQYRTGDAVPESPTAYELCYKCHSRSSILADQSFPLHRFHIVGQRTSCSICHDAHGIDRGQGNPVNNAHLINFDAAIVQPDTLTHRLEYRRIGAQQGQCFLRCHGVNHSPFSY